MRHCYAYGERDLNNVRTEYCYKDGRKNDRVVLVVSASDRLEELTELLKKCDNRIKARAELLRTAHTSLQTAVDTGDNDVIEIALSYYRQCEKSLHNAELDRITLQNQIVTLNNGQYIIY